MYWALKKIGHHNLSHLLMWTLLTKGTTTPKQGEWGSIEVEGVETGVEVKAFIKIDLPFVGGARAMLVKKKLNIEFRTVPYIKNAGWIGGRHTQPIQTPPFLVILCRRKSREGIHWRGAKGFPQFWWSTSRKFHSCFTCSKRKKFQEKNGENPIEIQTEIKMKTKSKGNPIILTLMHGLD